MPANSNSLNPDMMDEAHLATRTHQVQIRVPGLLKYCADVLDQDVRATDALSQRIARMRKRLEGPSQDFAEAPSNRTVP